MTYFVPRSLATKLMLITSIIVAIVLVSFSLYLIRQTHKTMVQQIRIMAGAEAKAITQSITGRVEQSASVGRTIAVTIGSLHDMNAINRSQLIATLKTYTVNDASFFGSWFAESLNAFDGMTGDIANNVALGTNAKGTFAPYWIQPSPGDYQFQAFPVDYEADWFADALKNPTGYLSEPFVAEETVGKPIIASLSFPVRSKGNIIGVAGVDLKMEDLARELSALRPFTNGRIMLISKAGKWLVGPQPADTMKDYTGSGPVDANGFIPFDRADGEKMLRIEYPVAFNNLASGWTLLLEVPASVITDVVWNRVTALLIGSFVVMVSLLTGLWFATRRFIQRPLDGVLQDVNRLNSGDYTQPVNGQHRTDETGAVAGALEGFRHKLNLAVEGEKAARLERQAAEAARQAHDKERSAQAALQQRMVETLAAGLSHLSSGNLVFRVEDAFPDSYARLKTDFNAAMDSLETTLSAVNQSVSVLNTGSGEIGSATRDLSQRTEQQAASLEETAAALDELTSQVNASADHAKVAANTVAAASGDAEQSGEIVQRAISAMHSIEQSSAEVGRIIGVIDEIAFQTNLLALNAGVEAARAGDAGRGFAVVAQEVRELAQRSANAAKEIKGLVNTSSTQVKEGVGLVTQAGAALESIATQVLQINRVIGQISGSASEQALGLKEINAAVNQMDQVTQQNAAMVEQTTVAGQTLADEAARLSQLVRRFHLAESGQPARSDAQHQRLAAGNSQGRRAALRESSWNEF